MTQQEPKPQPTPPDRERDLLAQVERHQRETKEQGQQHTHPDRVTVTMGGREVTLVPDDRVPPWTFALAGEGEGEMSKSDPAIHVRCAECGTELHVVDVFPHALKDKVFVSVLPCTGNKHELVEENLRLKAEREELVKMLEETVHIMCSECGDRDDWDVCPCWAYNRAHDAIKKARGS